MSDAERHGKHILLGLSGGVACYKAAELARLLIKAGATVQVAMTEAACQFMTPVTLQALTGRPVYTDQWDARIANNMAHIDLSREADALVVAPASADFIRKLAQGASDDLLSLLCLARPEYVPLLVAPAMNAQMWGHPATKRNCAQVEADGALLSGPAVGEQACGESGFGRMLEPELILEDVIALLQDKMLAGKNVLVTAGPTFEAIDPVRAITNLSSGKMGYAVARAAREAGANVTLVSGPTQQTAPYGVTRIAVQSAREMHAAVMTHIARQQVFVAVAAVADWHVKNASTQKIKKNAGDDTPQLEFGQNPDILAEVAARPDAPFCVGFAAESENLVAHGDAKRKKKGIPLLAGNIGHHTFGEDTSEIILFDEHGHTSLGHARKQVLARRLIAEIAQRLNANDSTKSC